MEPITFSRFFSCLLLLCSLSIANPVNHKKVDIDGNGVPDWCYYDADGTAHCQLADGTYSTVPTGPDTQPAVFPTGKLPSPEQFAKDNGTKWSLEFVGNVSFTGRMAEKDLRGDKCRSSRLGSKVIWNCGDMMCVPDWTTCGFAMGPAFYGTEDVLKVNTDNVEYVQNNDFLKPWSGDPPPQSPQKFWGMDTSNVAAVNDTHGIAYAWEIWRGADDNSYVDRGNAVASITLGDKMPVATRLGPLLTGGDKIALGLVAILRADKYIYIYSDGGPSGLIVTRVPANHEAPFDASKYEALDFNTQKWVPGIPDRSSRQFGMITENQQGAFACAVYGSAFYSNYFKKYVIICNIWMHVTSMYVSDTPYGPWSGQYTILKDWLGYGSHAHPEYSPYGSHKNVYFSLGWDKFNMFKLTFNY